MPPLLKWTSRGHYNRWGCGRCGVVGGVGSWAMDDVSEDTPSLWLEGAGGTGGGTWSMHPLTHRTPPTRAMHNGWGWCGTRIRTDTSNACARASWPVRTAVMSVVGEWWGRGRCGGVVGHGRRVRGHAAIVVGGCWWWGTRCPTNTSNACAGASWPVRTAVMSVVGEWWGCGQCGGVV